MEEKFADIDSIVTYVSLDDNEVSQVKLINSTIKNSEHELSIHSPIGKILRFSKEGEIKSFDNEEDSYQIQIISIINPIKKIEQVTIKPFGAPITLNDFISAPTDNYASYISNIENGLIVQHAYGTTAKEIYLNGVNLFGWDSSKIGSFGPQKLLFNKDCSPEGYSIWFITYSNLTTGSNPKTNWSDYINHDFNIIKECWKKIDNRFYDDKDTRITFARQKDGKYIYLGIFQAKEIDEENRCKTYHKINGNYCC